MLDVDREIGTVLAWHNGQATRLLEKAEECDTTTTRGQDAWGRLMARLLWHGRAAGEQLQAAAPYYCPEHEDHPDGWMARGCVDCAWLYGTLQDEAAELTAQLTYTEGEL